jgi:hypothetical protein
MRAGIPCQSLKTILTNHIKVYKQIEKKNIFKHKSCKGKIQRYTISLKISPEPEHGSTLPNSQLELIYYIGESNPSSSGVVT